MIKENWHLFVRCYVMLKFNLHPLKRIVHYRSLNNTDYKNTSNPCKMAYCDSKTNSKLSFEKRQINYCILENILILKYLAIER